MSLLPIATLLGSRLVTKIRKITKLAKCCEKKVVPSCGVVTSEIRYDTLREPAFEFTR